MKYMGSKRRFAKYLVPIIQSYITEDTESYIENFVGGANIIDKIKCDNKIGADNNEYLIQLYNSLKKGYIPLDFISREDFYDIKGNKEGYPKEVVALCGILASYNGNWFRAYGGYSKTKTGKDRNYYAEGVRNIMKQLSDLIDIDFQCKDYKEFSNVKNCVIYCDKEYENTDKTYKDKKFNHKEFWEWVRKVSKNNTVLVSEHNAPNDFKCIWEQEAHITHPNQKVKKIERLFIL